MGTHTQTHTPKYTISTLQHSPGNCTLVCHNVRWNICDECSSGLQSKYTPTLPAGLFVQPACYLDAGRVWWRWQISWLYIIFFMSVNPALRCFRKVPSLFESDSPCKALSPPFITAIVSTIIYECKLRKCVRLCVCMCACGWVPSCWRSHLCVFHVCACVWTVLYSTYLWTTEWFSLCNITVRILYTCELFIR